jgi:hypothetical protein
MLLMSRHKQRIHHEAPRSENPLTDEYHKAAELRADGKEPRLGTFLVTLTALGAIGVGSWLAAESLKDSPEPTSVAPHDVSRVQLP